MEDIDKKCKAIIQFKNKEGKEIGSQIQIPLDFSSEDFEKLLNITLKNKEKKSFIFYLYNFEIIDKISNQISEQGLSSELILPIVFEPQTLFKVRPVTRCTATLSGHTRAILSVQFSPNGQLAATGSGDKTIRIWDLKVELPKYTLKGHYDWVLSVSWSPNAKVLASGDKHGFLFFWNPQTGKSMSKPIQAHKKWITGISWEPMHKNEKCTRIVTSSKDGLLKVWNITNRHSQTLTGHNDTVNCVRWGGVGLIYSAGKDRMINVWNAESGELVRILKAHGHWVNHIALSSDYCMRTGCFNKNGKRPVSLKEAVKFCKKKYEEICFIKGELLVSASDDFTSYLWNPTVSSEPIAKMIGHQKLVNHVCFSPNGKLIASVSFDKSIKIWDGLTGKFQMTLRGHVGSVYQSSWSADSRLLVSSSKDSTLKIWSIQLKKLLIELPGHSDEVFGVDWSPDSSAILSGGKDQNVKIWKK